MNIIKTHTEWQSFARCAPIDDGIPQIFKMLEIQCASYTDTRSNNYHLAKTDCARIAVENLHAEFDTVAQARTSLVMIMLGAFIGGCCKEIRTISDTLLNSVLGLPQTVVPSSSYVEFFTGTRCGIPRFVPRRGEQEAMKGRVWSRQSHSRGYITSAATFGWRQQQTLPSSTIINIPRSLWRL